MNGPIARVTHAYPVPRELKKFMAKPKDDIVFTFINPTDALVRLLVMSPLAG